MEQTEQEQSQDTYPLVKVLDHGFVRLVDHMGGDIDIVRAARTSHNAAWRTEGDDNERNAMGKDRNLIHYLMKNRHTTPFEMVEFKFEVKAPIFCFRQWHRHRTWSYNEMSGRYTELPEEFYVPTSEVIGMQSETNKQGRDLIGCDGQPTENETLVSDLIRGACAVSFERYHTLLELGVPKELARGVLPFNTYSKMFAKVDLHNLFHFLGLRMDAHAQYETQMYANAMYQLIRPFVPVAMEAWLKHTPADINWENIPLEVGPKGIAEEERLD